MLLTAFIVLQIILDVEVVLFFLFRMRRRRAATPAPAAAPTPPAWPRDFLLLAEDVMALLEPVLDALESGALAAPAAAPGRSAAPAPPEVRSLRDRHREAFALLRAGAAPEDVASRERLGAGELRLIRNLVAAEAEMATAPRS
jgi:hypothetical protein